MSAAAPIVLPSLGEAAFLPVIQEFELLVPKLFSSDGVAAGQRVSEFPRLFGDLVQADSEPKREAEKPKPEKQVPALDPGAVLMMATAVTPFVPVPCFTAPCEQSTAPGDVQPVERAGLEMPPSWPVSGGSDAAAGAPTVVPASSSEIGASQTTPGFTRVAPEELTGGFHAAVETSGSRVPGKGGEELALAPATPHQPGKPAVATIGASDSSVLATIPSVTGPTPTAPSVPHRSATDVGPRSDEADMMLGKILFGEAPAEPAPPARPAFVGLEPHAPGQPRFETALPPLVERPASEPAAARMDLAFTARLVPLEPEQRIGLTEGKQPTLVSGGDSSQSGNSGTRTAGDLPGTAAAPAPVPRAATGLPGEEPKPSEESRPYRGSAQPETAMPGATPAGPLLATRPERDSPPAELHRAAPDPPAEPVRTPTHAREIRLHLAGEERRVEVRLAERGGAVQVAVRTQDSKLAGTLRDDLSTLSARLEQSGFRAETWHPDTARPEQFGRVSEPHAPGTAADLHDSGGRRDDRQERDPLPHRAPQPESRTASDSPPQEFLWLISSFR